MTIRFDGFSNVERTSQTGKIIDTKNVTDESAISFWSGYFTKTHEDNSETTIDLYPPQKDEHCPQSQEIPPALASKFETVSLNTASPLYKNTSVETASGKVKYDGNGFISAIYDTKGRKTKEIFRNADGSLNYYYEHGFDENGNVSRDITYKSDGTIYDYIDYEYNASGNVTKGIIRDSEGKVTNYYNYEYADSNLPERYILRNPDGSVKEYFDYKHGKWFNAEGAEQI